MIDINRTKLFLLFIVIFALPFNSLPINILGQLSHEGAFYPLLTLVLIFCFQFVRNTVMKHEIIIHNKVLVVLIILFCIYTIYILLFNYYDISKNEYMDKFGVKRFVFQYFQLLFGFIVMFAIASTIYCKRQFETIMRIISIAVMLFILFAIFQFLAYEFQGIFLNLYQMIGKVIYPEGLIEWTLERRHALHSVTQEPSFLSMYLSVMAPFVIARAIKKKKYILLTLLTLVIIMSKSRTGYVIYTFELFLFFYFFKYHIIKLKYVLLLSLFVFIFILITLATPLSEIYFSLFDLEDNTSNAARYAASYSSLMLWWNNNILFGIGLGQTGFNSIQYLPDWGFISGDVHDTVNEKRWPPIHNMLVRMLVEVGLIGFTLFLSIYMYILRQTYKIVSYKYMKNFEVDLLGYAVIVSLVCSFLIMFNKELLSNFNIWITWGLALAYININKRDLKHVKTI